MKKMLVRTLPGTPDFQPRPYEGEHAALAREAASEGIVLLENKILPLEKGTKLALFGAGASQTVKGGTGSGDVNERHSVSIYEGLENAGFQITTKAWLEDYDNRYREARLCWKKEIEEKANSMGFFGAYASTPFRSPAGGAPYKTDTDTAAFVLARVAGEGADRSAGEGDYLLTAGEKALLEEICGLYEKVILIVNAGGVVDLSFMEELPQIHALLVVSQPGMEGGNAIADVLSGDANPSGKLTDTWAKRYEDYPNAATYSHMNGNVNTEEYREGIYVGYRYFDTFSVPSRYSFGFGLSYTTFQVEAQSVSADEQGTVTVQTAVRNTGKAAGKEVVQVYVSLPDGRLQKEARRLVAFGKTKSLLPGEDEVLTLTFTPAQLESFDEQASGWVLEKGVYGVYVGDSLESSIMAAALVLEQEKLLKKVCAICPMQQELEELTRSEDMRRERYGKVLAEAKQVPNVPYDLSGVETVVVSYEEEEREDEASRLVKTLTNDQLIRLATSDAGLGQDSALGSAGVAVPGSAGETSSCALEQGIANMVLADGPAGLRLNQSYYAVDGKARMLPFELSVEHGFFYSGQELPGEKRYQFCTAVPVGTMLAQTWNEDLMERVGSAVGAEMELFGVQLWLAPGMNIHRNPLCGRNFEYFSEDPLVSGKCAAAITRGVQSHRGVGTTIKHFACNNQEDNRMHSDSVLSQRALREIYLKGFEIAIGESHPKSIMTSYNLINGVHAANCHDLCTKAARKEFGFDGVIMTDWTTTYNDPACTASGCMRAGNDLVMPGIPSDRENLRAELEDGTLTLEALRKCVTRLVRVILSSSCYEA